MISMSFFGLLILFLFIAGVAALFWKSSRPGRWVIGIVMIALPLVAISVLGVRSVRQRATRVHEYVPTVRLSQPIARVPIASQIAQPVPQVQNTWSVLDDEAYDADVYPSARAAAAALGQHCSRWLNGTVAPDKKGSFTLKVQGSVDDTLLHEVANNLPQESPSLLIIVDPANTAARMDEQLKIQIDLPERGERIVRTGWSHTEHSGTLRLIAMGQPGRFSRSVRFIEKPWLENFSSFTSDRTQGHWILAQSQGSCMSESEAQHQARIGAAGQLQSFVMSRLPSERIPLRREAYITALQRQLESNVVNGTFVADRFTQSLQLPVSGQRVWRSALLVHVSPDELDRVARNFTQGQRNRRATWVTTAGSAVGMVVVICVVYVFLNAATKGYFTWPLRLAVAAVVGVVVLLLIIVA